MAQDIIAISPRTRFQVAMIVAILADALQLVVFPLFVEGAGVVGSVTVSGLPQRDDHNLAVEALCALLGRSFAALRLEPESA